MFTINLEDLLCFAPPDEGEGAGTGDEGGGGGGEGEGAGNEGEGQGNGESTPDPVAEAADAKVKAELTKLANAEGIEGEVSTVEELQQKREARRQALRQQQTDANVTLDLTKTVSAVKEGLTGLTFKAHNDKGEPVEIKLSAEQVAAMTKDVEALPTQLRDHFANEFYTELGEAGGKVLPTAVHQAFNEAVAETDLSGWLNTLAEHAAPHTKAWKAREVEHEAAVKAAKAEGFTLGQTAPEGTPSKQGSQHTGIAGKLTKAAFESMTREEQAAAWRERPAEVEAL